MDSYYFEGVCYREMKQFDKAVEVLKQALAIQPLHASSEFALARALQAIGDKDAGEGTLQALPAHDEHEGFGGDRAGVWRAGALFDGDAGGGAAGEAARR